MAIVDWDKGLPLDVLALVAQAGGMAEMKAMRGASKTWQRGYEMGISGITISAENEPARFGAAPVQPKFMLEADDELGFYGTRFPGLTKLDVGDSSVNEYWLRKLWAFKKLASLTLGNPRTGPCPGDSHHG